ncbi:uncharacterized protein LOC117649031 [Thrips palmi]|uniref:Uncharacterized protein LOC117649031 n=1 Tax=Thrips palmi TaxID=161013 RepID=A0A6P8ZRB0_THRPL|nr:uncharacterized protein LOC117649031 [Thrips palmi]
MLPFHKLSVHERYMIEIEGDPDWTDCSSGAESSSPSEDSSEEDSDEPAEPLKDADESGAEDVCAVCYGAVHLYCQRCWAESYCGYRHLAEDRPRHDKWCFPRKVQDDEESPPTPQDAAILSLGEDALLLVCRFLGARDLVRLGQTCRALRAVCRDPRAWSHVTWSFELSEERTLANVGLLKVAPALHTIKLGERWPKVNMLRCTRRVKKFVLSWDEQLQQPYAVEPVMRLLGHWRGTLEVVVLGCLNSEGDDVKLLRYIDGLNIKELYIGDLAPTLVKAYPGSAKAVRKLEIGTQVSGGVLTHLLRACRSTLVHFKASSFFMDLNAWVHPHNCGREPRSSVRRALMRCPGLEVVAVPAWYGSLSMLHAWPALHSLCLYDFGEVKHRAAKEVFRTAAAAKQLRSLSLWMETVAHRGLLVVVAEACCALRELRLMFGTTDDVVLAPVDVPRDLHAVLGRLPGLEKLVLHAARVPGTVFRGLAHGALPALRKLVLLKCAVTPKGREALQHLRGVRPDLRVKARKLRTARCQGDGLEAVRCEQELCRVPSDCEDDDPVGADASDDDHDSMDSDDFTDFVERCWSVGDRDGDDEEENDEEDEDE